MWPWIASVGFWSNGKWNHQCGATLVSQTYIITAAHCVEKDIKKRYIITPKLSENTLTVKPELTTTSK